MDVQAGAPDRIEERALVEVPVHKEPGALPDPARRIQQLQYWGARADSQDESRIAGSAAHPRDLAPRRLGGFCGLQSGEMTHVRWISDVIKIFFVYFHGNQIIL